MDCYISAISKFLIPQIMGQWAFLWVCINVSWWWRRWWQPTPVLLPGKSHGWRSLMGCGPWGCEELDTTEQLHFHFSLSCIGEGNGNPLQCSCVENPRDGGAWWAAIYGVAQSRTWLKQLSSSSSVHLTFWYQHTLWNGYYNQANILHSFGCAHDENIWDLLS